MFFLIPMTHFVNRPAMGMILGNKVIQTLNCLNKNCAPELSFSILEQTWMQNREGHMENIKYPCGSTLVTQPMMQCWPNPTELRSMDSYIQILCRFQKSKRKFPSPSPLSNEKSPFTPSKDEKDFTEGARWKNFSFTFFGIYIKFGYNNSLIILNSVGFGRRCIMGWVATVST